MKPSTYCLHMYLGPDGVTDYNVHVEEQRCIGHDTMSPEGTGDVQYLCRAAKVGSLNYIHTYVRTVGTH